MKSWLVISFDEVADRERKHPGEEASGHLGALGKEASGIRGAWAPGRRVAWVFLGLLIVLSQLALGPGPIGALGLGRLARGTEPGPMVPRMPPFFVLGRVIVPGQKKRTSLTVISWGTVVHLFLYRLKPLKLTQLQEPYNSLIPMSLWMIWLLK